MKVLEGKDPSSSVVNIRIMPTLIGIHSMYEVFTKVDVNNKFARLPGRNMWQVGNRSKYDIESGQTSARLLHKNGYTVFGWDLEWRHDAKTGTPIQSVDNFIDEIDRQFSDTFTPGHLVILAHDEMFGNETEKGQLSELLQRLSKLYELKSIADYPLS